MSNSRLILTYILFFAAFFRLFGLNWDQGAHLHPDERFLTMVTTSLKWPSSFSQYFDPTASPLNPANAGYSFFVYGTFPLFFVKAIAETINLGDYSHLNLVGRAVSAIFDLGTVYLVYLITSNIVISKYRNIVPHLASFFYASSILPIQLSHFFAVDTFLVFFLTLSFFLLIKLLNSNNQAPNSKHPEVCRLQGSPEPHVVHGQSQNSKFKIQNNSVWSLGFRIFNLFGIWDLGFGIYTILLGIVFGLALASKVSALLFLPVILFVFLLSSVRPSPAVFAGLGLRKLILSLLFFTLGTYASFRLTNPYAFANSNLFNPTISPLFLQNLKTLKSFEGAESSFPPAIQWLTSEPLLFPLRNMLYYGLGIPLGILALGGFFYTFFYLLSYFKKSLDENLNKRYLSTRRPIDNQIYRFHYRSIIILLLIVLWVGGLFFYQGTQFAKAMRYFAPIYPFLAILTAFSVSQVLNHQKTLRFGELLTGTRPSKGPLERSLPTAKFILFLVKVLFLAAIFLWPLSFLSIYSRPHSRIAASFWIYQNIPEGSTLTCEHWDDCLPLSITQVVPPSLSYQSLQLPLYDPDTPEKWEKISQTLKEADYIILSSNRLFGSIPSVPQRYPITTQFYTLLFAEKLDFRRVAEFTSRPHLPIPFLKLCLAFPGESYGYLARKGNPCEADKGLTFVDDSADESFTVYDHPKVIIFQKERKEALFGDF